MIGDIKYELIGEETLRTRVAELGAVISKDYEGCEVMLVCTLKGASIFFADLLRRITIPVFMDFIAVSSYGDSAVTSGTVRILKDLDYDIRGKHIILVEDIIDSGLTMKHIRDSMILRGPASVKICCCLDKPSRRLTELEPDYCGFTIPNEFVVGYGLDYNEKYRNLPAVYVLKPEIYGGAE